MLGNGGVDGSLLSPRCELGGAGTGKDGICGVESLEGSPGEGIDGRPVGFGEGIGFGDGTLVGDGIGLLPPGMDPGPSPRPGGFGKLDGVAARQAVNKTGNVVATTTHMVLFITTPYETVISVTQVR